MRDVKKWLRQYMGNRRRQQRRVSAHKYTLKGGPFDGQELVVSDVMSGTLTFCVNDWRGRYVFINRSLTWRQE